MVSDEWEIGKNPKIINHKNPNSDNDKKLSEDRMEKHASQQDKQYDQHFRLKHWNCLYLVDRNFYQERTKL